MFSGRLIVALFALALAVSCRAQGGDSGSQTNWLKHCEESSECGGLTCNCGVCTTLCSESRECAELSGGSCLDPSDRRAVAACDGARPLAGMCLPLCTDGACPEGSACLAGICRPSSPATVTVSIEPNTHFQTLIGFGASLAHDEDLIVGHPDKERLFDMMFAESGLDAIRIRNRYELGNAAQLATAAEIVGAASARLEHPPLLFLSSGTPPAYLKANGSRGCVAWDANCTLLRSADGDFDYSGFSKHWRASLESYENVGIHPDFVSIQSNPDWLPPEAASEACHFLPREGTESVTPPGGSALEVRFAGYAEAMAAVAAEVSSLPAQYSFTGPEVGRPAALEGYEEALSNVDSLAYHLYGIDPSMVDGTALETVSRLSSQSRKPSLQTAMQADGIGTAILAHYALVVANSSAYVQQQFVAGTFDDTSTALVGANSAVMRKLPVYDALFHYARFTDPGWIRVAVTTEPPGILSSAWLAPDSRALTVILVNPTGTAVDVGLAGPGSMMTAGAKVVRTVFDGVERSAELGLLAEAQTVRLPARAIVTIAASRL